MRVTRGAIISELHAGKTQSQVAKQFGITKNAVAGVWWRDGNPPPSGPVSTLFDRCDALHAKMDAVLAATKGIPRVPNAPPQRR